MPKSLVEDMARAVEPCPFCDGEPELCSNTDPPATGRRPPMYWVLCKTCHASPGDRRTEAWAISAWNTRSEAAALAVLKDRLPADDRELLEILREIVEAQEAVNEQGERRRSGENVWSSAPMVRLIHAHEKGKALLDRSEIMTVRGEPSSA